jgi:superfamily II DNA or RNA helicase
MSTAVHEIPPSTLLQICGKQTFVKGLAYARLDRVKSVMLNVEPDGFQLLGMVEGSQSRQYHVKVDVYGDPNRHLEIDGTCSCPVEFDCKHAVALCLQFNQSLDPQLAARLDDATALPSVFSRWIDELAETGQQALPRPDQSFPVYVLETERYDLGLNVSIWMTRPRKNAKGFIKGQTASPNEVIRAGLYPDRSYFADEADLETCRLLSGLTDPYQYGMCQGSIKLEGQNGALALERITQTNRCFWRNKEGDPVNWGDARDFKITWQAEKEGHKLTVSPSALLLPTEPPLYWDESNRTVGIAQLLDNLTPKQIRLVQTAPTIPTEIAEQFSDRLAAALIPITLPTPVKIEATDIESGPTAHITLDRVEAGERQVHCLWYHLHYGGHRIKFLTEQATQFISDGDHRYRIHRDMDAEHALTHQLMEAGFAPYHEHSADTLCLILPGEDLIDSATKWHEFLTHMLPRLEADGWVIDQAEDFRMLFLEGDWHAETEGLSEGDAGQDWFDVRFDLTLENNQKLPLAPLLAPLMGKDPNTLPEQVLLPLGNDQYTHIKTERLKPYLETLTELFQRQGEQDGSVRMSRFDLTAVDELDGQLLGAEALRKIAQKLKGFNGIETVPSPEGLRATLRPYQQQGLNWLQFLREYDFNGILADDMGLGKTLQAIAHILTEKQQGRLTEPALIIAPTSLMGNWRHEVEKFAPSLNIIVLHGTDRHAAYDALTTADLVVTTYALAYRDLEQLKAHHFHLLILDEAQAIKNPKAKIAHAVREIRATHRLCLTGTPMENHLGELWALFDFLMPGFLATQRHFKEFYRGPIEKQSDQKRLVNLQKRVSPFILRRNKTEVAKDLPPKTEIQHLIAMDSAQSKLYESIRVSMDKQVRDAIAQKGLAQSHIMVLDALLKLRQTCCDPRLLKMDRAQAVQESAKIEALLALLEQLLSEGRRVLIFSQFTTMLTLIESALKSQGITLTKLTGKTKNRDKAIHQFREGKADVFLISLKAGGTGLNLVEADTVIIYDPWWNPAAENQAIDRAHRIGQDKPVFVYRLIVENSVEEKILKLQTHKKALADGIYDDDSAVATQSLDAETIQSLFAPMSSIQ